MAIYTFITDFKGGTYISQHHGRDLREACTQWRDGILSRGHIQLLDAKAFGQAFATDFEELPPVAIEGLTHVWTFQLLIEEDMLDVHIVQTEEAGEAAPNQVQMERTSYH